MEYYFDHAATTAVMKEIVERLPYLFEVAYGNPSSLHRKGHDAERIIDQTKEILAQLLKVTGKELFFTSGGTESNNLAIVGIAKAYQRTGKHIISTCIEHPSILAPLAYLEEEGFEITYLPVDENGLISLEKLKAAIRPDTILVSVMHVNNEIGVINKIEAIGNSIKEVNPNTIFHVDGIQSFGKLPLFPKKFKIDALSVSGHKIGTPKGVGFLYLRQGVKIKPIMLGGHQQNGIRSGTENVPGIASLGIAAQLRYHKMNENYQHVLTLKQRIYDEMTTQIERIHINGLVPSHEQSCPYILNLWLEDIKSEVFLHTLEENNIYVSTGSACASNKANLSSTLIAIGRNKNQADQGVRISFSPDNTMEEVEFLLEHMKQTIPKLRRDVKR